MTDPWRDAPFVRHSQLYRDWIDKGGGTWPQPRFEAARKAALAWFDNAPLGASPDDELRRLAEPLGLFREPRNDVRLYPSAEPATDVFMQRVAVDIGAAAADRTDRVVGPWFSELDPRNPAHRRLLVVCTAIRLFAANGPSELSLYHQWCHRKPRPSTADRDRVRAVGIAPLSLWGLDRAVGDRWQLSDLVGLWHRWLPDGPVRLREPAAVAGDARPGDTLAARLVHHDGEWIATQPLIIPGRPPDAAVKEWLRLELAEMRLYNQRLTVEALLRGRGHRLACRAHALAWNNRRDVQ